MTTRWMLCVSLFAIGVLSRCGDSHGFTQGDSSIAVLDVRGADVVIVSHDVVVVPRDTLTVPVDQTAPSDRVALVDVVTPGTCAADNATINTCFAEEGGGDRLVVIGVFFDGKRCVINHGNCVGPDCYKYSAFPVELAVASCEAANAHCMQIKCAQGGGYVRNGCDVRCGADQALCGVGAIACDCGPGKSFNGSSCVLDSGCTPADLCRATGGLPAASSDPSCARPAPPAPSDAGNAGFPLPPCSTVCECPIGRDFLEGRGCIVTSAEPTCSGLQCMCMASGGRWMNSACGHTNCGEPSLLACATGGCTCGPDQVWDNTFGCVDSFECKRIRRPPGVGCSTDDDCQEALACCSSAPITGGARTCTGRVCGGDRIAGCPPSPA